MDIEGFLSLILLVLHWRIAVCLLISICLAVVLVTFVPWLTGLQGIVLAALGMIPGAMWEERETAPQHQRATKTLDTTATVAGASAIIVGATWGVFSSTSIHSFLAGAIIFVLGAWGWCRYAKDVKHWVQGIVLYSVLFCRQFHTHWQRGLGTMRSNMSLNLAPFGRWTLRDKVAQRRLVLR